jgi:hypothetical protein
VGRGCRSIAVLRVHVQGIADRIRDQADGRTFRVARHRRLDDSGDRLRRRQRVQGSGRLLAVELQKGWRGARSGLAMAKRDLLVRLCATPRTTAGHR